VIRVPGDLYIFQRGFFSTNHQAEFLARRVQEKNESNMVQEEPNIV
jgi:hypothetical protein